MAGSYRHNYITSLCSLWREAGTSLHKFLKGSPSDQLEVIVSNNKKIAKICIHLDDFEKRGLLFPLHNIES